MSNETPLLPAVILERLLTFLSETFVVEKEEIDINTSLVQTGIIDSIGLIEIAEYIESTYGFQVTESDLTRDNFGSATKIVSYIHKRSQP